MRVGRAARIGALLAGAIALVIVLAQLLLPGIAASRIRSRVGRYGTVESVAVTAWPAVELLWGQAGSVNVQAGKIQLSTAQMAKLLEEARGTQSLRVTAASAKLGPLRFGDATLEKHGDALHGTAWISARNVRAALGGGLEVELLHSGGGQVEVSATGGLFGVRASVQAVAEAREGKVVLHPRGFPLEGLKLTLFATPEVYVEGVAARAATGASGRGAGYRVSIWASLR